MLGKFGPKTKQICNLGQSPFLCGSALLSKTVTETLVSNLRFKSTDKN